MLNTPYSQSFSLTSEANCCMCNSYEKMITTCYAHVHFLTLDTQHNLRLQLSCIFSHLQCSLPSDIFKMRHQNSLQTIINKKSLLSFRVFKSPRFCPRIKSFSSFMCPLLSYALLRSPLQGMRFSKIDATLCNDIYSFDFYIACYNMSTF